MSEHQGFSVDEATTTEAGRIRGVILDTIATRVGQVAQVHPRLLEGIEVAARKLAGPSAAPDPTPGEEPWHWADARLATPPGEVRLSTPRTWPENAWPTAAELADWLSRCTTEERMEYADRALSTAQDAAKCLDEGHAARLAARDAEVEGQIDRLCDGLHKWREDAERYLRRAEAAEAEAADLRKAKSELGEMVTEWMLWGAQRRHAWQSARRRAAELRAKVERVEALATRNWYWTEGRVLLDALRAALGGEHDGA